MNNFSFTGRLTHDATTKATASGVSMLQFSVANNTGYGERSKTNYINCTLFGKRAEGRLIEYLNKGQEVAVNGELNLNQYTRKDGTPGSSLECTVNSVDLIGVPPQPQRTPVEEMQALKNILDEQEQQKQTGERQAIEDDIPF